MVVIEKAEFQICPSLPHDSAEGLRPYTILVREDGNFDDDYPSNSRIDSLSPVESNLQRIRARVFDRAARIHYSEEEKAVLNRPTQLLVVDNVVLDRILEARKAVKLYADLARSGTISMMGDVKLYVSTIRGVEEQNLMDAITEDLTGELAGHIEEVVYLR